MEEEEEEEEKKPRKEAGLERQYTNIEHQTLTKITSSSINP